jgi:hypothetical protein
MKATSFSRSGIQTLNGASVLFRLADLTVRQMVLVPWAGDERRPCRGQEAGRVR